MASTFVNFTPTTAAVFSFRANLAGNLYTVSTPWNVFGQRYYLNIQDLNGNQILFRSLVSSGPSFQAALSWDQDSSIATATVTSPHNVPVGDVANIRISQTGTSFDGGWQALSTGPLTMTYALGVSPRQGLPINGSLSFPVNLVAGYNIGWLLYHYDTLQFEFQS